MPFYTPFSKNIESLDEIELVKLIENNISEGWYIEYKSDFPKKSSKFDSIKIAKSISSFANTKGGWIFYGVESNDKNIATNLIGIDIYEVKNIDDQISQIISSNIAPKPIFHFKKVQLKNERHVFVIKIDEGTTPPYITSQGVIYQRENNESNPIKDRYIIEKLTEKTNDYYESIERFCKLEYTETKGQSESNQSYLELYIFPIPFNQFRFEEFYSTEFFEKVSERFFGGIVWEYKDKDGTISKLPLNLGFNSIYSSSNSIIIRPVNNDNLIYKTTTVELLYNGSLKFTIPLNEFDLKTVPKYYADSSIIEYLNTTYSPFETVKEYLGGRFGIKEQDKPYEYSRRKETDFVNYIRMIDGVELLYVLLIITSQYKAVLEDMNFDFDNEIGFRVKLTDTWRKFVFFDNEDYFEKIKKYNLPISPKNTLEIPKFLKGKYCNLDLKEGYSSFQIAGVIFNAIGLPDSTNIKYWDIILDGIKRFNED
jgi:hypothetical protein